MARSRKSSYSKKKKKSSNMSFGGWKLKAIGALTLVGLSAYGYWYYENHDINFNIQVQVTERKTLADSINSHTESFIAEIAPSAISLGQQYDLYPSVMIAQATLESSSGTSGLAYDYGNLFGIKGEYHGQSVSLKTWEDDGNGNAYEIMDNFRVYPSWEASLEDYALLLNKPWFSGALRSNTSSYLDATQALTGTYATDTAYNSKLNYLIDTYNLTQYDGGSTVSHDSSTASAGEVWNPYRGRYTSQEVLVEDEAWANR